MKAVLYSHYGPADVLRVADLDTPHPGPGEIRIAVRAAGVTPSEALLRSGVLRDRIRLDLPHVTGVDAAGTVDAVGDGVTGVGIGDEVYGMTDPARIGGAHAEYAVLVVWAPKPAAWSWEEAGGAAANVETATRVLDRLAVRPGSLLLVNGAAGGVGTVLVQLAAARGARVLGTASERNHAFLRSLGVTPTTYGPGLVDRVRALVAPEGDTVDTVDTVDAVADCAGGALPDLVAVAGGPDRVVTIADFAADSYGVHMSHTAPVPDATGIGGADAEPAAYHGLATANELAAAGRLVVPLAATFPFRDAADAHRLAESRHARGKIVMVAPDGGPIA